MKPALFVLSLTLILIGLSAFQETDATEISAPKVLELFTSQSCSSCPPADAELKKLQDEDKNIIALSCNVTYWNHLHWKDTLSKEFCSARQRNYSASFGSGRVYTPQLVINAQTELVGSQERKVRSAIKKASPLTPIKMTKTEKGLSVILPTLPANNYYPTLFLYGDDHTQTMPSGENRGRTVDYTNPIIKLENLEGYRGKETNIIIHSSLPSNAKGAALLIHKNTLYGPIVAAGKIKF